MVHLMLGKPVRVPRVIPVATAAARGLTAARVPNLPRPVPMPPPGITGDRTAIATRTTRERVGVARTGPAPADGTAAR